MNPLAFFLILIVLLGVLTFVLIWLIKRLARRMRQTERYGLGQTFLTNQYPRLKESIQRWGGQHVWQLSHAPLLELTAIIAWAAWVGQSYLNPDIHMWPTGGEYGLSIQSYFVWQTAARCGLCGLWNGGLNGGAPAFAELQGSVLHPLAVISSLLLGAINGSKLVLIGSLATAGIAQWWLAKVLNLGRLARLWSAGMAVVAGDLAGRMEHGVVGIVVSTAACSLVLAPLIKLALTGNRRVAVQLGIVSALAILSGQGYLQIGVVLCYLPAVPILIINRGQRPQGIAREFVLAGLVAALLAAIFLVPLLHFWPNFDKDVDPYLGSAQPFEYGPLNLVIRDLSFYGNDSLQKAPIAYMYMNYVGWVPVILAVIAVCLIPSSARRLLAFLVFTLVLAFFVSSAVPLRFFREWIPSIAAIRFPSFIAGLAVPPLLLLAAWGLDLIGKLNWPRLAMRLPTKSNNTPRRRINTKWLVLAVPLIWSIQSAQEFGTPWLGMIISDGHTRGVVDVMKPATTQWIGLPAGEAFWTPYVLNAGLKLSPTFLPWHWKDRTLPSPYINGTRDGAAPDAPGFIQLIDGIHIAQQPENEYAFVDTGTGGLTPCQANAIGGDIDVTCNTNAAGQLIVRENSWSGWTVSLDGQAAQLGSGSWLSAIAPAGTHHFEFRYRPWDVWVGLLLTIGGVGLSIWLWIHAKPDMPGSGAADSYMDNNWRSISN